MFISKYIGGRNIFKVKNLNLPYEKIYDYVRRKLKRTFIN